MWFGIQDNSVQRVDEAPTDCEPCFKLFKETTFPLLHVTARLKRKEHLKMSQRALEFPNEQALQFQCFADRGDMLVQPQSSSHDPIVVFALFDHNFPSEMNSDENYQLTTNIESAHQLYFQ